MSGLDSYQTVLDTLRAEHQWRQARCIDNGIVDFSHNDYLGLSKHSALIEASCKATEQYGIGATGSRLISGTSDLVLALEQQLAEWKGTETALVFNSGYQANVAILQALLDTGDTVFLDRLNHASIVDGVRLSGAKWHRYQHLDLADLERKLQKAPSSGRKWIVTDSLFSMDGDYPDLTQLCNLADEYGAFTLVDEAHASGVFGKQKRSGLCETQNVSKRITLQMGTFSKALGSFGAYVAGPNALIDTLINKARGFIYSTALPPSVIAANQAAVSLVQSDGSHTETLWNHIDFAWKKIETLGIQTCQPKMQTQIIPIQMRDNAQAVAASQHLLEAGFFVQAIRSPTVPKGSERLRLSISASHTQEQIERLLNCIHQLQTQP